MRDLLILNDIHLGVKRVAGTTPASQEDLGAYLQGAFIDALSNHMDKDILIAGDLFDEFTVSYKDLLMAYDALSRWLSCTEDNALYLMAGNHDVGKRDDRLSSFAVLSFFLRNRFKDRVTVINRGMVTFHGNIHVVPHCMNQELFEAELEKAKAAEPGFLVLHANCDSPFTEHSDHSLNVSAEWLAKLSRKHRVLFAHEHQRRIVNYEHKDILVLGNQWPSSISDCLAHGEAQKNGKKFLHVITQEGEIEQWPTWEREGSFVQVDWRELTAQTPGHFLRVTGEATAHEASEVVSVIAKARAESAAFVISNAVKVGSLINVGDTEQLLVERVQRFSVMEALRGFLTAEEQAEMDAIMEEGE